LGIILQKVVNKFIVNQLTGFGYEIARTILVNSFIQFTSSSLNNMKNPLHGVFQQELMQRVTILR
jgi:uncharacterized membrane protein required for colicin V production